MQRPAKFTRLGFRIECCGLRLGLIAHHGNKAVEFGTVNGDAVKTRLSKFRGRYRSSVNPGAHLGPNVNEVKAASGASSAKAFQWLT